MVTMTKISLQEEQSKICMVMMPFSDPTGYQQGHFKRVYDYLIRPACEKAGFKAKRVDENAKTSVIVLDILNMILDCDMAICDLSARNPNVFYELGFRQAFDKKCVLIIDSKTDRPFDTSMLRTISYDESLRIDLIKEKVDELSIAIKETYENRAEDGNSLVQLLAIKSGAKIPDKKLMNSDLGIVLSAIQGLSSKIDSPQLLSSKNDNYFKLPNGEILNKGDDVYVDSEKGTINRYGIVEDITDRYVIISTVRGDVETISKNELKFWSDKSQYPF